MIRAFFYRSGRTACRLLLWLGICLGAGFLSAAGAVEKPPPKSPAISPDPVGDGGDPHAVVYRPGAVSFEDYSDQKSEIRVLVQFSRTTFFVADGSPMGLEYEVFSELERFINRGRSRKQPPVKVVFIPLPFDQLLPRLLEGKGDVAAGLIAVTPERLKSVSFAQPYITNTDEVLVSRADFPGLKDLTDLSGRTVHVLKGSSFAEHLRELNRRFEQEKRPPVIIREMPSFYNVEDILEMVNAGLADLTLADSFEARLWSRVFPGIRILPQPVLRRDIQIAWAVRPGNPKLREQLTRFVQWGLDHLQSKISVWHRRYFQDTEFLKNPMDVEHWPKTRALGPFFKEAGSRHQLDWLMMMAQGFQESGLNQSRRSPKGAVGVMQVLPQTAREMGISNIHDPQFNIQAGVAYLDLLRKNYFHDPELPPEVRVDFALAAYNAGPGRIRSLRALAAEKGLDPNRWFGQVELLALDKLGEGPFRYVRNIHRYYLTYKTAEDWGKPFPASPSK